MRDLTRATSSIYVCTSSSLNGSIGRHIDSYIEIKKSMAEGRITERKNEEQPEALLICKMLDRLPETYFPFKSS